MARAARAELPEAFEVADAGAMPGAVGASAAYGSDGTGAAPGAEGAEEAEGAEGADGARPAEAERTVDPGEAAGALLAAYFARTGRERPAPDRVAVRSWTPNSARKVRRRTFVQVDVDGRPFAVAKIPLSAEDPKLARELRVLRGFGDRLPVGSPRPMDACCGGFSMSHLPGTDLPSAIDPEAGPDALWRLLRPAVDRVVELHRTPPPRPEKTRPDQKDAPRDPVEAAAQYVREPLFGVAHADAALRRALLAPTHGDLGPWNVRCEPDTERARVLDFEDYRESGVAAMDAVNLLVTCALPVFPDYTERGFDWLYERVFSGDHWFSSVLLRGVAHYARGTDQPAAPVLDLLPLTCQWLIERIEAEGRQTAHLFYGPFKDRYLDRRPSLVGSLDD
ncbi:phosphotransferase family protein [Streptomyces winkii]|uniref:phosphotransferase family protein n=1 Tax=Streptomyces winkii TaxID=3051178 RepID=UPI0028D392BB|nr:phosphotransferase [Streptomyces sp. DSM 40971]